MPLKKEIQQYYIVIYHKRVKQWWKNRMINSKIKLSKICNQMTYNLLHKMKTNKIMIKVN